MENKLFQLLLSMKIGDGCYINHRKLYAPTYCLSTNSINKDYVDYKKQELNKHNIYTSEFLGKSGYASKKPIYGVRTRVEPEITLVGRMTISEILDNLDLYGLILYYLDDGSLHKSKYFMHIYCNKFTDEEVEQLIDVIHKFFPEKRCSHRKEHKKDGRTFNYVYINKQVAEKFSEYVREFLLENNINSLLYKTISPSQTIENIHK